MPRLFCDDCVLYLIADLLNSSWSLASPTFYSVQIHFSSKEIFFTCYPVWSCLCQMHWTECTFCGIATIASNVRGSFFFFCHPLIDKCPETYSTNRKGEKDRKEKKSWNLFVPVFFLPFLLCLFFSENNGKGDRVINSGGSWTLNDFHCRRRWQLLRVIIINWGYGWWLRRVGRVREKVGWLLGT